MFTARYYTKRGSATVCLSSVCPSVRPSVTFSYDRDHISWNTPDTSKLVNVRNLMKTVHFQAFRSCHESVARKTKTDADSTCTIGLYRGHWTLFVRAA